MLLITIWVASTAGLPASQVRQIDALVTAFMARNQVPGLSMAVVKDGRLIWSKGYGMADMENRVPCGPTTVYRSGSMGKPMVATAALRLVEEGKLDLDADIRGSCPAYPAKPWKITARNLLQHTSGIRHYGGPHDDQEQYSAVHYASVPAALAPFKDDSLLFEPGSRHLYSSYGFDVLGCVIEGAAGVPFLDVMRSRVWDPAGMRATREDDPAAIVPRRAAGYALTDGKLRRARMADMSNRIAAGCFLTTAEDLAAFAVAMIENRLVKPETFRRMTTPLKLPNGDIIEYGMGWGVETELWHDDQYLFHGGSSPGVSGFFAIMPKHRCAVLYLTNLEDIPGQARGDLGEDVTRVVLRFGARKAN
jgi:CubicO group peptidase (beta-lactamase class C family)